MWRRTRSFFTFHQTTIWTVEWSEASDFLVQGCVVFQSKLINRAGMVWEGCEVRLAALSLNYSEFEH